MKAPSPPKVLTLESSSGWPMLDSLSSTESALKISTVYACVEIISGNLAMLPIFVQDSRTRTHQQHSALALLNDRPNEAMTALGMRKYLEAQVPLRGDAYCWLRRGSDGTVREMIPLCSDDVTPTISPDTGKLMYIAYAPYTRRGYILPPEDVLHLADSTTDGLHGVSVLERARLTLETARNAQRYERAIYANGGRPSGVLQTDSDLGSIIRDADGNVLLDPKGTIRREWEKFYSGPDNAYRTAVLDQGLKYVPVTMSNADTQFVESKEISVMDICRFFLMPPHKVGAGKQTYESNESNAIEYIQNCIQPKVTLREQELSYKLLSPKDRSHGLEARVNMMALLRSDIDKRGEWYKTMDSIGAFSVNDILALEDMPDVPGGDVRKASLNYIPLEDFRELSRLRNDPRAVKRRNDLA